MKKDKYLINMDCFLEFLNRELLERNSINVLTTGGLLNYFTWGKFFPEKKVHIEVGFDFTRSREQLKVPGKNSFFPGITLMSHTIIDEPSIGLKGSTTTVVYSSMSCAPHVKLFR